MKCKKFQCFTALVRYHWPENVRELQNVMAAQAVEAPTRGHVRAALLPAVITGHDRDLGAAEHGAAAVGTALRRSRAGARRTRSRPHASGPAESARTSGSWVGE